MSDQLWNAFRELERKVDRHEREITDLESKVQDLERKNRDLESEVSRNRRW